MIKRFYTVILFSITSVSFVGAADLSQEFGNKPKSINEELEELELKIELFREGYKHKLSHLAERTPPTKYLNEKLHMGPPPPYYGSGSRF